MLLILLQTWPYKNITLWMIMKKMKCWHCGVQQTTVYLLHTRKKNTSKVVIVCSHIFFLLLVPFALCLMSVTYLQLAVTPLSRLPFCSFHCIKHCLCFFLLNATGEVLFACCVLHRPWIWSCTDEQCKLAPQQHCGRRGAGTAQLQMVGGAGLDARGSPSDPCQKVNWCLWMSVS